jgi:hypothetical protein
VNKYAFKNLPGDFHFRIRCLKQKSSSGCQKSFNMMSISKLGSDLSVPAMGGMDLAPCAAYSGTGCQGFVGPLPSAFLDKL